jgi:clan AA aspartic protease
MGVTYTKVKIYNPAEPKASVEQELLVDSGAILSIVPANLLKRLGIRPISRQTFSVVGGRTITRDVGVAIFQIDGRRSGSDVIFGTKSDPSLLGVVTLESLGLQLDPVKRTLRPTRMVLYSHA